MGALTFLFFWSYVHKDPIYISNRCKKKVVVNRVCLNNVLENFIERSFELGLKPKSLN